MEDTATKIHFAQENMVQTHMHQIAADDICGVRSNIVMHTTLIIIVQGCGSRAH